MPRLQRHSAVVLRYQPEEPFRDAAPRLVAKGEGLLADRILELAKQHGIPVEQNPDLLAALQPLNVDSLIPPDLFQAVAVMLASMYRANLNPGSPS